MAEVEQVVPEFVEQTDQMVEQEFQGEQEEEYQEQEFNYGFRLSTQPMQLPTTFGLAMPALLPVQPYQFQAAQSAGLEDTTGFIQPNIQSTTQLGNFPFVFYAEATESEDSPAPESGAIRTRDAMLKPKKGQQNGLLRCLCA